MPVRSLNSAVIKWPNREQVLSAARQWAATLMKTDVVVLRVLCVGSYARDDWGVGSDLDVIVVTKDGEQPQTERYLRYHPAGLPVPVDLWVYTVSEWESLCDHSPHLWRRLQRETLDLTQDEPIRDRPSEG